MIDPKYQERVLSVMRDRELVPDRELSDEERAFALSTIRAHQIAVVINFRDLGCVVARELPPALARMFGIPR
jgi:hypothetical protein